jgi:hypothetical protein
MEMDVETEMWMVIHSIERRHDFYLLPAEG